MSAQKKRLDDEEIERLAHEAARAMDWLLPESAEEFARAEEEAQSVQLPPALQDASMILDRAETDRRETLQAGSCDSDVVENLAQAARDGGAIPPEIEERMRTDRLQAEGRGKRAR